MTIIVFRCLYLILVLVGLVVNISELRNAMLVYQTLVTLGINGARQVLASHFVRKAVMLCGVQIFLAVPALIALSLITIVLKDSGLSKALTLVAVLSHMAAVLCLMLMALMSWYDRNFAMNMLATETMEQKRVDTAEKVDVAAVLKDQFDAVLSAIKDLKETRP